MLPGKPSDSAPKLRELLLNPFVAAVDVVDAVDYGATGGGKAREDQGGGGAQVGGHDGGTGEAGDAAADHGVALDA